MTLILKILEYIHTDIQHKLHGQMSPVAPNANPSNCLYVNLTPQTDYQP